MAALLSDREVVANAVRIGSTTPGAQVQAGGEDQMKVEGQCHCGHVRFEATLDPERVAICHCTDCQMFSSAPFRVGVRAQDFRVSAAKPKVYVKTADSGRKRNQAFCPECGTPIYTSPVEDPSVITLRIGTLRERSALSPKLQIWCESRCGWVRDLDAIAGIARQP
jgi:hypothetical protein